MAETRESKRMGAVEYEYEIMSLKNSDIPLSLICNGIFVSVVSIFLDSHRWFRNFA